MMKTLPDLLLILISLPVVLSVCGPGTHTGSKRVKELSMQNPASRKCIDDGGRLQVVSSREGDYGVCIFRDGSVCEEWEYFRSSCKKGDCLKRCMKPGRGDEGWYDCWGVLLVKEKCPVNKGN